MPRRRARTPEELAKENEKLRRRVERLTFERDVAAGSIDRWVQALRNTLRLKQLRRVDDEYRQLIYEPERRPREAAEQLSWEDVANRFRWTFEDLANGPIVPVRFRQVVLPPREGWILRDDAVDWWPIDQFDTRVAEARRERWSFRYESRKGIQQTAEMLWDARDDAEAIVGIWLSAFLHDRDRFGYDTFEYDLVKPLQELMSATKRRRRDWHHAMKNLVPWQLISRLGSSFDVKSTGDLVDVVAANAALASGSYELVHFVEEPKIALVE
jgi:hypothetical protein